ncbi:MAG: retroviral-like aspartic protease family protein [Cyanobacteriota bacterium]|nr:retroviral-like aspartic protease family protein [Cyanobacteriota bacterium]
MLTTDNFSIGKIVTELTVTNRADQNVAARGFISASEIRSVTLDNVLVDTGATTLCLPSEIVAQLGLDLLKEVDVETATGIGKARIFRDATIVLGDREGTFECLELPGGGNALLGVIPLEALGIELDFKNQRLVTLPISPTETYLTIL